MPCESGPSIEARPRFGGRGRLRYALGRQALTTLVPWRSLPRECFWVSASFALRVLLNIGAILADELRLGQKPTQLARWRAHRHLQRLFLQTIATMNSVIQCCVSSGGRKPIAIACSVTAARNSASLMRSNSPGSPRSDRSTRLPDSTPSSFSALIAALNSPRPLRT
jgi:hypothetical protein